MEDVHFVYILIHPLPQGAIADVANLQRSGIAQLALDAKVPRHNIRLLDMLIHAVHARVVDERKVGFCFAFQVRLRRQGIRITSRQLHWRFVVEQEGRIQNEAARREVTGAGVAISVKAEPLIEEGTDI